MSQAPRPQAQKTPAEGVWRHTTDNNYAPRFKYFTFDAQNVFTGWTITAAELNMDDTGDANTGSATIQVYDTNGNLVATGQLMFEAANPDVFAWYIKSYGADVNLFVDLRPARLYRSASASSILRSAAASDTDAL
jgi:hypothetical protein